MKLDILAFGPHPDDVELGCGGTLAKFAAAGKKTGIVDLTQGEMGTRGTIEERLKEAQDAADILGASTRENLKMRDGFFENNEENQLKIIRLIRKYQPDIVIASAPKDRHPDHGRAAELVSRAAFLSGLKKVDTGQEAWRPGNIFHYIQWLPLQPDFIVDISDFLEIKVKSCLAHTSQFHNPDSKEPETAVSSQTFKESITYRAQDYGRIIWKDYGEAFIAGNTLGVENLDVFL